MPGCYLLFKEIFQMLTGFRNGNNKYYLSFPIQLKSISKLCMIDMTFESFLIIRYRVIKLEGLFKTRDSIRVLHTLSVNKKEFIRLRSTLNALCYLTVPDFSK